MSFGPIPYMEWAKTHLDGVPDDFLDLANSGMPSLVSTISELGIDPAEIPLGGDNSYGYPPLQEAIAQRFGMQSESILTAQGTSMSNFLLLASLVGPGDTILVETPVYECLSYPPEALRAEVVNFERRAEEEWLLPVERITSLAKQHKAKAVFFANPNNPTGSFDSDSTICELADRVGEQCMVIVDEVYREWLDGEYEKTVALQRKNIVSTSSLTKVWGLGPLRAGWAIGDPDLIHRAFRAFDNMAVINAFMVDWVQYRLISNRELLRSLRDRGMESVKHSRILLDGFLQSPKAKGIEAILPADGGYGLIHFKGLSGDEVEAALMREKNVSLVPGSYFGLPDWVRISWTRGEDQVREGLKRIGQWWLDQ